MIVESHIVRLSMIREKKHFPNHAVISAEVYEILFPNDEIVNGLILMDMDINIFAKRPEAISLLITGLCEIHANASMFGGMDMFQNKVEAN